MCSLQPPIDVDFRIMSTFTEFYTTLLGFVNYRLYHSLGLVYPPKLLNWTTKNRTEEGDEYCGEDEVGDEVLNTILTILPNIYISSIKLDLKENCFFFNIQDTNE